MDTRRSSYHLTRPPVREGEAPVLDAAQQAVVDHVGGPLLVLAGPGTGKTTTIVATVVDRVARRGVSPERVLVLTFSRKAAQELRERISARLRQTIRQPLAMTFHSYAWALLRREFALAGETVPTLLPGPEQLLEVRRMLRGDAEDGGARWPQRLRPALATAGFAAELRDFLLRASERGLDGAGLASLGAASGRDDWVAAGEFLARYGARFDLAPIPAYDYAEVVRIAAAQLVRGSAGQRERGAYDLICVDEYQDTDPAQELLLHALASAAPELIAVGDPDQSIYGFRGADSGALGRFPDRFRAAGGAAADVVALRTCRRSGAALLAASRRVAARLPAAPPVPVFPRTAPGTSPAIPAQTHHVAGQRRPGGHRDLVPAPVTPPGSVRIVTTDSAHSEATLVADVLRQAHLRQRVPWSDMAVLVRSVAHQVAPLRRALAAAGVPVSVAGDELPLESEPGVRPLLLLLRCALAPATLDEDAAADLLTGPLGGTDTLGLRRIRRALHALDRDAPGGADADPPCGADADPPCGADADAPDGADADAPGGADADPPGGAAPEADRGEAVPRVDADGLGAREGQGAQEGNGAEDGRRADDGAGMLARVLADPRELTLLDGPAVAAARRVAGLLALARETARTGSAHDVLWAVWEASGLARAWQEASAAGGSRGAAADRDLDAVCALFDAAARFTERLPPGSPGLFLDSLRGQEIPGDTLAQRAPHGDAVAIMTAHRAKGLEWDVVVVAGVQEGVWPDLRTRSSLLGMDNMLDAAAGVNAPGSGSVATAAALAAKLLAEERRLFYVAVTRARRALVVTATGGDDSEERPSRFLAELAGDPASIEHVAGSPRRRLSLSALTADLRRAAADPATPMALRRLAAAQLARLAAAGVRGAHPRQWYQLTTVSGLGPLTQPDGRPERVSPSVVESFARCGLRWLLERAAGARQEGVSRHFGIIIHAAAVLAATGADEALISGRIDEIWHHLDFGSRWYSDRQREQAQDMVAKFLAWHLSQPRELVATELPFRVQAGDVEITGRVDRLERDETGRAVVVDLKTGSAHPSHDELDRHPQLGVYQLSVLLGAFERFGLTEPGGAELVQVGKASLRARVRVQHQQALPEDSDPAWAGTLVDTVATGMAGPLFQARANPGCRNCPVRSSCPVHPDGEQVGQ